MNGRTIFIGSCVMGSLIGLGFLAHYVYGREPENQNGKKDNDPVKKNRSNEQNSYNRTRIPHARRHKNRPPIKPERKVIMVEEKETAPPATELAQPMADEFPLRLGSEGKRVERLQVWLMRNYGWTGKISGVFDEKTEALVKRFLRKTMLDEDTYYKMKMGKPVYEQIVMR